MTRPTSDVPTDVIRTETMTLREPPARKRRCIEFLVDVAATAGYVADVEAAVDAVLERETQAPTGVGKGVAIPHAKTNAVDRPVVVFARSSDGVDFEALDDEPATLLFLLLVPADCADDHLQILSAVSRSLVHESTRRQLRSAESVEEIQTTLREGIGG